VGANLSFMLTVKYLKSFRKDKKKLSTEQKEKVSLVVERLVNKELLAAKYKDHILTGNYKGSRECHVEPDLLLVYKIEGDYLKLARVGKHPALFG